MRTTDLPSREALPVLGLGTWRMGEDPRKRRSEIEALRTGIELGMTRIDTAEMYADGGAEEVVGEATSMWTTWRSSRASRVASRRS